MKSQCDKHGCNELLCGCSINVLESNSDISEIVRAKDKWINELLDQAEKLQKENFYLANEVANLETNYKAYQKENEGLREKLLQVEKLIETVYETCLCERFKTYGFDYGEKHPRLDIKSGSRRNTPRAIIEQTIGYVWKYEKPEGCCNSWKILQLKKNKEEISSL